jgi:hypothetical protein
VAPVLRRKKTRPILIYVGIFSVSVNGNEVHIIENGERRCETLQTNYPAIH